MRTAHPDVAAVLRAHRFERFLPSGAVPRVRDTEGHRLCCWDRVVLPKRRSSWYSDECADEFWIRFSGARVRALVFKRDGGVCARCGTDTESARRGRVGRPRLTGPWDADHIVPVIEGGGVCGLEGYRTVCRPCHIVVTAELKARLATARRRQRSLPFKSPESAQPDVATAAS